MGHDKVEREREFFNYRKRAPARRSTIIAPKRSSDSRAACFNKVEKRRYERKRERERESFLKRDAYVCRGHAQKGLLHFRGQTDYFSREPSRI